MSNPPADMFVPVQPAPSAPLPIVTLLLQLAHRTLTVCLLSVLASAALICLDRDPHVPLAVAAGCSIVAGCAALLVLSASPRLALAIVLLAAGAAAVVYLAVAAELPAAIAAALTAGAACAFTLLYTADPRGRANASEATGVLVVSLVLAAVAFTLVLRDRTDVIREGGRAFFTPPPVLPPQP